MTSDVFDEYAKIAFEQGLVEKVAYPNNDEYIKKMKDGRQGSDDIATIELMYGVMPNGKDEPHILDQAHSPDHSAVVSQSYDRMNGVVETLFERQNIMADIALKNPNVNITQTRYVKAHTNLLNNLVRLGFMLDTKNSNLMKLADDCSEALVKTADLKKEAFLPIVWLLGTGLSLLGGMSLFNNISPADQGVINNTKNALTQLEEAKGTAPKVEPLITQLIQGLTDFLNTAEQFENTPDLKVSDSGNDLSNLLAIKDDSNEINKTNVAKMYINKCRVLQKYLPEYINHFKGTTSTQSNLPKGLDYFSKALELIWPKPIKDVYLALDTLYKSISDTLNKASEIENEANSKVESLTEHLKEVENNKDVSPAPQATPESTPAKFVAKNEVTKPEHTETLDELYQKLMS